ITARALDAGERRRLVFLPYAAARDLPRQIAFDDVAPLRQRRGADIAQHDVEPRQRADMRDAAPHLPGADDADMADLGGGGGGHCWRFPSSSSSSGRILNRSPTRP